MPTGIPFGYQFQGSDVVNILVRMVEDDDGKVYVFASRCVANGIDGAILTGQEFWFHAERYRDLRKAVETLAWHMDQVQEHGTV